mgnify:CR=1 FL=1
MLGADNQQERREKITLKIYNLLIFMVKVVIYEDSEDDLIQRYGSLVRDHEVHVRIKKPTSIFPVDRAKIIKAGFVESRIIEDWFTPIQGDVYFLDGLNGDCLPILERLPRGNSFLNTGTVYLEEEARKRGHVILETTPQEAIRSLNIK